MKKFIWPLEKVLELKIKQEDALKAEMMSITQQAVNIKSQIITMNGKLRMNLIELKSLDDSVRIMQQCQFMKMLDGFKVQIDSLNSKLGKLEKEKQAKLAEILEIRKMRKGLERLREKAHEEYKIEIHKIEENELNDLVNMRFAREIMLVEK